MRQFSVMVCLAVLANVCTVNAQSADPDRAEAERLMGELRESLAKVPPVPDPVPDPEPLSPLTAWLGYAVIDLTRSPPQVVAIQPTVFVGNVPVLTPECFQDGVKLDPERLPGGGWKYTVPGSKTFHAVYSSENGVYYGFQLGGEWQGHELTTAASEYPMSTAPCSQGVCGTVYSLATPTRFIECGGPRCAEVWKMLRGEQPAP